MISKKSLHLAIVRLMVRFITPALIQASKRDKGLLCLLESWQIWLTGTPTHQLLNIATQFGTNTGKEQCQHSAWMLHTQLYKIEGHYENVQTDTRQQIHRRRLRISPSAGIHFSDATGEEQLFEKQTMSWEFRHSTARLNRRQKSTSSSRNLAHLFLSNW